MSLVPNVLAPGTNTCRTNTCKTYSVATAVRGELGMPQQHGELPENHDSPREVELNAVKQSQLVLQKNGCRCWRYRLAHFDDCCGYRWAISQGVLNALECECRDFRFTA